MQTLTIQNVEYLFRLMIEKLKDEFEASNVTIYTFFSLNILVKPEMQKAENALVLLFLVIIGTEAVHWGGPPKVHLWGNK